MPQMQQMQQENHGGVRKNYDADMRFWGGLHSSCCICGICCIRGGQPAMTSERRTTGKVIFQLESCPVCGRPGLLHLTQYIGRRGVNPAAGNLAVWHGAQGWPRRGGVCNLSRRDFPEIYEDFLPLPGPGEAVEEEEEDASAGGREVGEEPQHLRPERGSHEPGGRETEVGGA